MMWKTALVAILWLGCGGEPELLGERTSHEVVVAPAAALYNFDTDVDHGRALARDGDVLVAGAPKDDFDIAKARSGTAYVRYRNLGGADAWGVVAELRASDAASGDCFGRAVAVAGDLIAVGAKCRGTSTGAVYVFLRDQGGADHWGEVARLTAADGRTYDRFGRAVAISGDVIAVGAPGWDERSFCIGAACPARPGAVYLFGRNVGGANAFGLIKKLSASDANPSATYGDQFGIATAFAGGLLAVGSQGQASLRGAVYLFDQGAGGAGNWGEIKKVTSGVTAAHCFGGAVAVEPARLAVGAPCESASGSVSGAAYVFGRDQGGAGAWGLVKKVIGSGVDANDVFGDAVALAGDRLFVGATAAGAGTAGAWFVFDRLQGGADSWGEVRRVELSDGAAGDEFGAALASDGALALVAAPGRDRFWRNAGAIYTFARDAGGTDAWGLVGPGIAPPTAESSAPQSSAHFGSAVAATTSWLVVGAYSDRCVGNNAGAAMVYARDGSAANAWRGAAKLVPPPGTDQHVGWSVAISGSTIVVGGYLMGGGVGGALVYELDASQRWQQVKQLAPSDGVGNGWFGISVDIHGDTLVVGAPGRSGAGIAGAAYVYERDLGGPSNWGERKKLLASDALVGDEVGGGVAIDGDTIVVGAPRHDHSSLTDPGAAYVFARDAGGTDSWGEVKQVIAPDAVSYQSYGADVDLEGDTLVIGAKDTYFNGPERMQTYLYGRDVGGAGAWGLIRKLEDADTASPDAAGWDVAIAGPLVVVGAWRGPMSTTRGAVYVFARDQGGPGNWGLLGKQTAPDGAAGDAFGKSVAVAGDLVLAGSPDKDYSPYSDTGRAYVFRVADPCLPNPCTNGGRCSVVDAAATCTCPGGYTGATCADDLDECALGTHTCSTDATCTNAAPGYSCACNDGFAGDGTVCEPLEEDPPAQAGGCCDAGARPGGAWLLAALALLAGGRRRRGRRR